jgi:HK97 family phage prohead protease
MQPPEFTIRTAGTDKVEFLGYASVTEVPYEVGSYTEVIKRGAFKRSVGGNPDVALLLNHDGLPLARTKSGTLRLSEDHIGLRAEADLDASDPHVAALVKKLRRGDVSEMSFAFRATEQEWDADYTHRTILAAEISRGDVSIVAFGANPHTTASIRAEDLTFEQRKARARTLGSEIRGGVPLVGRKAPGVIYSVALNSRSPLESVKPMSYYRSHLADIEAGRRNSGDAVADARARVDEARNDAVRRDLRNYRQWLAERPE